MITESIAKALLSSAAYGVMGIVLTMAGFKLFDWITPKIDLQRELAEKNVAVAVAIAGLFLSIGYVMAHAIS